MKPFGFYSALITVCLAFSVAGHSSRRPFRSIKSVRETVNNYEILQPTIMYKDNALPHPTKIVVVIPAEKETYVLNLTKNHVVMPNHFSSFYHDKSGRKVVDKTVYVNCYYQGEVRGHPDWTVIMSTCHGLQGEFGDIENKESFFHLEPLDKKDTSLQQPHAFYLDTEYMPTHGGCGIEDDQLLLKTLKKHPLDSKRVRRQTVETRFVEWVMVIDNAQFMLNNNDLAATVQRAIMLANGVDNIYRVHGIRVILISTITFTLQDAFPVVADSSVLLDNFTAYVQTSHVNTTYDSMMLFTGLDLIGSTIGLAFVGTMCNRRFSTGLTQDAGASLSRVASVAAHELGHIFNMRHDDGRVCTCTDPTGTCVMSASLGSQPPTQFSSCSISDLNELYGFRGDTCLFNSPSMTVGDPVCGNGIPEEGEACDCGSVQECTNNCCNASTCQLVTGAQCALGECCSSECQFMAYGSECRAAAGECDLAEYCLGNKSECPEDFHAANGAPCKADTGYCMEGTCPTHADQCRAIFGSGQGEENCYGFNTDGDPFNNCGRNSDGFIACDASDVLCGMLQCMNGTYTGVFNAPVIISTLTLSNTVCRGIRSSENPFIGQVEEGTRCGDGLVCNLQQCVTLDSLNLPLLCPKGRNNVTCSGNGVCNNRGRCSCRVGYEGDACEMMRSNDTNECLTENGGCAHICNNTEGSFQCSCFQGFALASNNLDCIDIDECLLNNGGCSQICMNFNGSFACDCNSGYVAVGFQCLDINECDDMMGGCEQGCTNTVGSFSCFCNDGFNLSVDGRTCIDIDECLLNNGGCSQICTNLPGSFACDCNSGYTAEGPRCLDINECDDRMGGCEQGCTNTNGSFFCFCNDGYNLRDERTCIDIDECLLNNGGCSQICMNLPGSFTCNCSSGYTAEGPRCLDINECDMGGCEQGCNNTNGSFFCFCNDGYNLGRDQRTCNDIDECLLNNGGCSQICTNLPGSFACDCNSGYTGEGPRCLDINECDNRMGGCEQSCTNTNGSFFCFCNDGYNLGVDGRTCSAADTSLVKFEKAYYEVMEDIGLNDLALRVCVTVSNLPSSRNITLYSADGSTQGRSDYKPFVRELTISPDSSRECIGIVILEDEAPEPDETFTVSIAGSNVSTTVTIRDDDDTSFNFTGDSPTVKDNDVTLQLSLGGAVVRATCALVIGSQLLEEADCTNGRAEFTNLRNRFVEWTPRITITDRKEISTVHRLTERNFRIAIGSRRRCSVHLINDGIKYFNNTVSIEWGLSGPSDVEQSQTIFTCSLNGGRQFQCSSPYIQDLTPESNSLYVRPPRNSGGCIRGIPRNFSF